ncbi:MAG: glycosyltransferase [Planctomycetes bacterium]|nr:glycosyltransferase [Planctomycetota bacterium]
MAEREVEASVIVPFFRAAATLQGCLEALVRQDTDVAYEIIAVDNVSDDASGDLAREMMRAHPDLLRVVTEETPGSYSARNAGLTAARGRLVLFTDADCRPAPSWMSSMVVELRDDLVLMVGGEVVADPEQRSLVARYSAREEVLSQSHTLRHPRGPFIQTANLGVRLADARAVDGFDATLFSGGDADFCWRLRRLRPAGALRLVGAAIVQHVHRETLWDLYRQYRRYGQSDVLLAKKHGASLPHTLVKLGVDFLRVVCSPILALLLAPFALVKRDVVVMLSPLLRAVRVLGRRRGQVQALLLPGRLHRA